MIRHVKRNITFAMTEQLAFIFGTPAPHPAAEPPSVTGAAPAFGVTARGETQRAPDASKPGRRRGRRRWGRYGSRRRAQPQPKPFLGYGAYRLVVAKGVAHVIGPGGVRCEELTSFARAQLEVPKSVTNAPGARAANRRHDPRLEGRRLAAALDGIRMLLEAINWVHPDHPGVLADMLNERTAPAREVTMRWLRLRGCDIGNGRGRTGGKIVFPSSADEQWTIGVTITRIRDLFDHWRETNRRNGPNPMLMDADRSRLAGKARLLKKGDGDAFFVDVDNLFRTKMIARQAPRPHDESVPRRILERGREMGWPVEVSLKFETMYRTGARIGQSDALTAYGLMVAAKDDRHAAMVQKGSRGLLRWQVRVPTDLRARLVERAAGFLKGGMAELKRLAAPGNEKGHARLARLYVFSSDGRAPTPAWTSAHLLRLVVEDLGLKFVIQRDDGSMVVKHFTSHWFRHAFVNGMLDRIAASALDAQRKEDLRLGFARYMGWRNQTLMLQYYGRHHFEQETGILVAEHQDSLNMGLGEEFEAEDLLVAANDNGFVPMARASGDLLG